MINNNMTVQQLAVYLQVHENTIYEWLEQGTVFPNAFKIRRGWRIPLSDVRKAKQLSQARKAIVREPRHGFVNRWKG